MVKRSREQELNAALVRHLQDYSQAYDGDLIDWDNMMQPKYTIAYNSIEDVYEVTAHHARTMGTVYFYSKAIATQAISDVVMLFIKEHPEII